MTLISHNLHTQVIMALTFEKFYFFKKDAEVQTKDAEVLGNTIQHLCVFQMYVRSIVGILNTVSPHILY